MVAGGGGDGWCWWLGVMIMVIALCDDKDAEVGSRYGGCNGGVTAGCWHHLWHVVVTVV